MKDFEVTFEVERVTAARANRLKGLVDGYRPNQEGDVVAHARCGRHFVEFYDWSAKDREAAIEQARAFLVVAGIIPKRLANKNES